MTQTCQKPSKNGGDMPHEHQGIKAEVADIYMSIKDGMTDTEIMEMYPNEAYNVDKFERIRQRIKADENANIRRKLTVKQLYDEYIAVKKYEVREITLYRSDNMIKRYILPILEDVRIDKLTTQVLQDWKLSMEERNLALATKRNVFTELRTMLNYAVRMEYIPKHQLSKVRKF